VVSDVDKKIYTLCSKTLVRLPKPTFGMS